MSWFNGKIKNKVGKPLVNLIYKRKKTNNEKLDCTTNEDEIKAVIRSYFAQLHVRKIDNLNEMDGYF